MDYPTVRAVHIGCAVISITLFAARGAMQLGGVDWRRWRWLRMAPHLNDTVLLAAAVALAVMSAQYPLVQPWLTAKLLALGVYVALGRFALKRSVPPWGRRAAFAAALASVGYIVAVARTRSVTLGLL
ncbi:SirB2 family protein [Methylibium sp.]|uniref:SirB2 family protein n=1 Tax=Methylibium sp. TaxID=2067992 RepID=UPI003D10AE17